MSSVTLIKNVIVLGATGNVGHHHFRSATSGYSFPADVHVATASYDSPESLKQAFTGQDAIVEAFNPAAAAHQKNIVDAAIQAGVKHIITPDYSSDTFNENAPELHIFEPKIKAQKYLELQAALGSLRWIAIIVGPFYDWAIPLGRFWVDAKNRRVTVFGLGNQKISMSAIDMVGRATVAVLSNPEKFANRPAYFADYTVSANEVLAMLNELTAPETWAVDKVPVEYLFQEGQKQWDEDTKNGVQDRLNSAAYINLGTYGVFEESNRYAADFHDKAEPGYEKDPKELKKELEVIVKQA
ncbi:hypothetical protein BZG36_02669 [Bifiguratus adelaidae]|uniref:NmrA-like domain-containing protein n=1 Tax=Bifiguratus adelaidae TaxID=1938954 RepID=A0A261Y1L8_9FUNG|nr:hypothetical protein BZG36_02669 [Bifiguratus adelaidae]